jgi:hypothetical protein
MIKRTPEQIQADLTASRKRLQELRKRGNKAVSKYDLSMGYNAKYSVRLVKAHIHYYEQELTKLI